jgi:hypothetical protein
MTVDGRTDVAVANVCNTFEDYVSFVPGRKFELCKLPPRCNEPKRRWICLVMYLHIKHLSLANIT